MQAYFRMNNEILDLGLSPNELKVAVCLYSCVFRNNYHVQIKQSTIAEKCGIKKTETVSKIIRKLQNVGVIERIERPFRSNGWLGTQIYILKKVAYKGYFKVKRDILGKLTNVQLRMYLFICKAVTKKNEMWNSFNDIARALQIARNKVIEVINELVELGVIVKKNVLKKDGSYSDNHYSISEPKAIQAQNENPDKKEESPQQTTTALRTLEKEVCTHYKCYQPNCQAIFSRFVNCYSGVVP